MGVLAADANAIAKRPVVALHEVEEPTLGVDDDRARRVVGAKNTSCFSKAPVSCSSSAVGSKPGWSTIFISSWPGTAVCALATAPAKTASAAQNGPANKKTHSKSHACSIDCKLETDSRMGLC